jgi:hypothetical protein
MMCREVFNKQGNQMTGISNALQFRVKPYKLQLKINRPRFVQGLLENLKAPVPSLGEPDFEAPALISLQRRVQHTFSTSDTFFSVATIPFAPL